MTHPVLALQAADLLADQLRHRRGHLPEREQVVAAQTALADLERKRASVQRRITELEAVIERSESHSHDIDTHRARLEKQMKTIIAPREAEALQHEIATLEQRRSELDDAELEALEEQSQLADDLTELTDQEPAARSALEAAEEVAATAGAEIDAELASISAQLDGLRAEVDPSLLARYDQARKHQMVAVAELVGHRCSGCHLDLSAGEVDVVKAEVAAGRLADCPQCNRLLIV